MNIHVQLLLYIIFNIFKVCAQKLELSGYMMLWSSRGTFKYFPKIMFLNILLVFHQRGWGLQFVHILTVLVSFSFQRGTVYNHSCMWKRDSRWIIQNSWPAGMSMGELSWQQLVSEALVQCELHFSLVRFWNTRANKNKASEQTEQVAGAFVFFHSWLDVMWLVLSNSYLWISLNW